MTPAHFRNLILHLALSEGQLATAQTFFEEYDMHTWLGPTAELTYLGSLDQRTCRFCGCSTPEVTFETLAHVLPDFMGNRNVASYFECDSCNNLFSRYESTFANYFGISRTISQILGKSGTVPGYQDDKQGFHLHVGDTAMQLAFTSGKKPFVIDRENKTLTIKTTRAGYVPLHLVKLLWKVGIALLPEQEVADFAWVRQVLLTTAHDQALLGDKRLQVYLQFLPGPPLYPAPHAQLFTRRVNHSQPVFDKLLVLYYANYVLQVVLPSRLDFPRLWGEQAAVPIFPNIVDRARQAKYGHSVFSILDFSSARKKKKEPHEVTLSFEQFTKLPLTSRGTVWARRRPKTRDQK